jgi:hypothetical protein
MAVVLTRDFDMHSRNLRRRPPQHPNQSQLLPKRKRLLAARRRRTARTLNQAQRSCFFLWHSLTFFRVPAIILLVPSLKWR